MAKPTIIITGTPTWAQAATDQLAEAYTVIHQTKPDGYINAIIESLAAMVLIDGAADDWVTWSSVPKSSPATRRVPILLVSDEPDVHENAEANGADYVLSQADLLADLPQLVRDKGRLPDPEREEQLACECLEALPQLAEEGVSKFNAGAYYEQHDLFEEQWVNTEGPVRDLYRAVLQVGVAYFQIQRGNQRGALKMLQRSVQWLVTLPDECQGINVAKLREDSFKVRAELERLGEQRLDEFDQTLLKDVEWTPRTSSD